MLRTFVGAAFGLAAAVGASPIEPEDVAAARAAQREGMPERLEPLVTTIQNERAFEEFIQLHKPSLGKVLFFSKLATSELCDSLASHFDGQLDVLHLPPSATDVAAKFEVEELPAVYIIPSQALSQGGTNTVQLAKYEGNFKFGGAKDSAAAFCYHASHGACTYIMLTVRLFCATAFDRIVEFLDKFGAHSGCSEPGSVRRAAPAESASVTPLLCCCSFTSSSLACHFKPSRFRGTLPRAAAVSGPFCTGRW